MGDTKEAEDVHVGHVDPLVEDVDGRHDRHAPVAELAEEKVPGSPRLTSAEGDGAPPPGAAQEPRDVLVLDRPAEDHGARVDDRAPCVAELVDHSFVARLDLFDRDACRRWFASHGMVDSYWLYHHLNVDVGRLGPLPHVSDRVVDDELDIGLERVAVDWHLQLLTLLSQTRETKDWKPAWGQVVLEGAAQGLIVGGPYAGRLVTSALTWDADRERWAGDPEQPYHYEEQAVLHEATAGWPRVVMLDTLRQNAPMPSPDDRAFSAVSEAQKRADVLGTSWDEALELLRLTIEPRVQRALESHFTTELVRRRIGSRERSVLEPLDVRTWRSVLHPIYLQILEALRLVTEGEAGATICRECGRPFLVLDARRRLFCNDRERYRYAQRERRRRLRSEAAAEVEAGA